MINHLIKKTNINIFFVGANSRFVSQPYHLIGSIFSKKRKLLRKVSITVGKYINWLPQNYTYEIPSITLIILTHSDLLS